MNQALADLFRLDKPEGALVSSVAPAALIRQQAPGTPVLLEVWRQGKRAEVSVRLGDANEKVGKVAGHADSAPGGRLGLALRDLQPSERHEAGIEAGLLVERVGGPAAMAGVQPGDLLLSVNGTPVRSIACCAAGQKKR